LCPIRTHRGGIGEYSMAELVTVVRWIESDTLLRTEDELVAETMRVLGFIRKGSNITGAIRQAIAQARRTRRPGLP
jgi:Arc/MetJ family transcription regulator